MSIESLMKATQAGAFLFIEKKEKSLPYLF